MFDITTQSSTGLTGSDTSACSGWLCSGSRTPAIAASTELCPAALIATLSATIVPRRGLDPDDPAACGADRRHLAILDDVDAARVGGAGIAPGDRVVPRHPAAPLQRRAEHRVARVARRY